MEEEIQRYLVRARCWEVESRNRQDNWTSLLHWQSERVDSLLKIECNRILVSMYPKLREREQRIADFVFFFSSNLLRPSLRRGSRRSSSGSPRVWDSS